MDSICQIWGGGVLLQLYIENSFVIEINVSKLLKTIYYKIKSYYYANKFNAKYNSLL